MLLGPQAAGISVFHERSASTAAASSAAGERPSAPPASTNATSRSCACSSKVRYPRWARMRRACSVSVAARSAAFTNSVAGRPSWAPMWFTTRTGTLSQSVAKRPSARTAQSWSAKRCRLSSPRHRRTSTRSAAVSVQSRASSSSEGSTGNVGYPRVTSFQGCGARTSARCRAAARSRTCSRSARRAAARPSP